MRGIIVGAGEIGQAYYEVLSPHYPTFRLDVLPERTDKLPKRADILHICLRWSDSWHQVVRDNINRFLPSYVNVMSTVPPGTTEAVDFDAVHSTTRGLHPALAQYIRVTPKHVGGGKAHEVAEYFRGAGLECIEHPHARITELCHIASNTQYAASILFAAEIEKLCRDYGVDYYNFMRYSETHNLGYARMGLYSKLRPIVHPPGATLGGHCIQPNALLIPEEKRGPIMRMIAGFGK